MEGGAEEDSIGKKRQALVAEQPRNPGVQESRNPEAPLSLQESQVCAIVQ